jgi:hypothetical protein
MHTSPRGHLSVKDTKTVIFIQRNPIQGTFQSLYSSVRTKPDKDFTKFLHAENDVEKKKAASGEMRVTNCCEM